MVLESIKKFKLKRKLKKAETNLERGKIAFEIQQLEEKVEREASEKQEKKLLKIKRETQLETQKGKLAGQQAKLAETKVRIRKAKQQGPGLFSIASSPKGKGRSIAITNGSQLFGTGSNTGSGFGSSGLGSGLSPQPLSKSKTKNRSKNISDSNPFGTKRKGSSIFG